MKTNRAGMQLLERDELSTMYAGGMPGKPGGSPDLPDQPDDDNEDEEESPT